MELNRRTLAARLTARRAELRLEQAEVAERAHRSRAYISRLEGGLVPNPKLFDLEAVARALDTPLSVLLAPETRLTETRFSHELAELQRQIAELDLPDEIKEQTIRGFLESVSALHAASLLGRRN